jgi:hypothetical protein
MDSEMLSVIECAAINFCEHQIRKIYDVNHTIPKMRMLIASIEITRDESIHLVYVAISVELLQQLCEIFLFETHSDEGTLRDMLLETTNMIVGSAKVIAQEHEHEKVFNIATPNYIDLKEFDFQVDKFVNLSIDGGNILIAIKE